MGVFGRLLIPRLLIPRLFPSPRPSVSVKTEVFTLI
ncbi:MAG: hypothetical protein ACI81O_002017 [Cyclobacteriaceae bacterium]|jgi:hypothetical protein